jgi:hypothetical protein
MICPTPSLMIFLILSLSKDAVNHPARTFAEVSFRADDDEGWREGFVPC